jgi:hypothetical protein
MIEKEELVEMLIRLSRIDGYLHSVDSGTIHDEIDYISEILVRELKGDK